MPRVYRKSTLKKEELVDMAKNIKLARSILKLTAKQFGVNMGFHPSYVSQIEMGNNSFTLDFLIQCYKTYRINPNFLLFGFRPIFMSNEPLVTMINQDDLPLSKGENKLIKQMKKVIENAEFLNKNKKDE